MDDIDPVTDFGGTGGGTVLPVNPGGLIEREPDTCGASGYQDLVGQNQSVVATLGLTRPSRIFGQNDIVTQEYDPARINFEVSPSGQIRRISCG
ncbi:MAG: I78 family peptidase inhibitor [Pseudomonadota bacterium]